MEGREELQSVDQIFAAVWTAINRAVKFALARRGVGTESVLGPDTLAVRVTLSGRSRRHSGGRRRRERATDDDRPPRARRETSEQCDQRESESQRLHSYPPSFRNS